VNKTKVKITGTLLTAVFILWTFTAASPVGAYRRNIRVPQDCPTIQEAIDAASDGDRIHVESGEWYGGIVDKPVKIIGTRGAVIVDGPEYPGPLPPGWDISPNPLLRFGFFITPEGSGSTISYFTFRCARIGVTEAYLTLPIFARFGTDNVIVTHNEIYIANIPSVQCITNWDGDNWVIKYNTIIAPEVEGDFLGVFIGSLPRCAFGAKGNVVAFNKIVADASTGSGISLFSRVDSTVNIDVGEVSNNKVAFNDILVTGPGTSAISLQVEYLTEGPTPGEILYGNVVMFNDLRGSSNPIAFDPPELEQANRVLKNPQ